MLLFVFARDDQSSDTLFSVLSNVSTKLRMKRVKQRYFTKRRNYTRKSIKTSAVLKDLRTLKLSFPSPNACRPVFIFLPKALFLLKLPSLQFFVGIISLFFLLHGAWTFHMLPVWFSPNYLPIYERWTISLLLVWASLLLVAEYRFVRKLPIVFSFFSTPTNSPNHFPPLLRARCNLFVAPIEISIELLTFLQNNHVRFRYNKKEDK